ncbi:hypothetical protein H0H87_004683 [Tephrocybe sp. NHM501043]|nr:hypothetical protein H0H87_004683 [Tephrocybe sp. NHM501043]
MTTELGRPPLDPTLYSLEEDELAFYKAQTGIKDETDLKEHILAVQEKAYEVFHYPCIRRFGFTKLKISRLPAYPQALALHQKHSNALFLDIGCCFGNDTRKIVADGWPIENVVASDLRKGISHLVSRTSISFHSKVGRLIDFWNYGHDLFKSTPESFPATFIEGDAFDPTVITPRDPFYAPEHPATLDLPLSSLTSLTPLQGRLSAIHASSFFHLFDEAGQLQLARQVASLLSPTPGSIIFGSHGGKRKKGFRTGALSSSGKHMFCHSPETWKELWDGKVFREGTVRVDAGLYEIERKDLTAALGSQFFLLWWSVMRL